MLDLIEGDLSSWEGMLPQLAASGQSISIQGFAAYGSSRSESPEDLASGKAP